MTEQDVPVFSQTLSTMMLTLSHGKTDAAPMVAAVWFEVLRPYTLAQVTAGMTAHMRAPATGRTLPIPADIVAQIEGASSDDGRPGGNEAWSIALDARHESATVVWTEEMAEAWAFAYPIMDIRDETGARMAFLEAYARCCKASRAAGRAVRWTASLGHDEAQRARAIQAAAAAGRLVSGGVAADVLALPAPRAAVALPAPTATDSEAKRTALAALRRLRAGLQQGPVKSEESHAA